VWILFLHLHKEFGPLSTYPGATATGVEGDSDDGKK